jgi:hypothetical protein
MNLPNVMWAEPNGSWSDFEQNVSWTAWDDAERTTTYPARDMLVVWPASLEAGIIGLKSSVEQLAATVNGLSVPPITAASVSPTSAAGAGAATSSAGGSSSSSHSSESGQGKRVDDYTVSSVRNVLELWLTAPKTTIEAEEQKSPALITKMLQVLGQAKVVDLAVDFIKGVLTKNHRDQGKPIALMLRAFGWSDEVLTCVSDCLLRPLKLGLGDAGQYSLICLEDGKLSLAQLTAVDIVAITESEGRKSSLEVAAGELIFRLADDSLLSRYLTVVGLVCESMRDTNQPFELLFKRKMNLDFIVTYVEKLGVNVETHALHLHYAALMRHQQDAIVSYLCQDRSKSWKHNLNQIFLMKIKKVICCFSR